MNDPIPLFHPNLSWSHYRILMTIEKPQAREFYERELNRERMLLEQQAKAEI